TDQDEDAGDRTAILGGGVGAADSTFITNDEQSFIQQPQATSSSTRSTTPRTGLRGGRGGGRGASSGIARGRGGSTGITRAGLGGGGIVTKRKKEEMAAFADPVFPLLPINLRENRRQECEKVLWELKQNPQGLGLSDLTKHLAGQTPPVPQVRINEVLLALVRAKVATKGLVKGVNLYRLDETRFS
ncbi:hypothetical protein JCM3765_006976, partial [Sporobolomyces pararoseus]